MSKFCAVSLVLLLLNILALQTFAKDGCTQQDRDCSVEKVYEAAQKDKERAGQREGSYQESYYRDKKDEVFFVPSSTEGLLKNFVLLPEL